MAIVNDKQVFNNLGGITFTVNLENCKDGFKEDLYALLKKHNAKKTNRLGEAAMLGMESFRIEEDFCDVVNIYFNNGHYCTFSFHMLYNLKAFETMETENEKFKKKQDDLLFKYSDYTQVLYRLYLVWDIIHFLKQYDVYETTKIKSISFVTILYSQELYEKYKPKVVEVHSKPKDGTIYKTIEFDDIPKYTKDIVFYEAFVKYSFATSSKVNSLMSFISDLEIEYLQNAKKYTVKEEMEFLKTKLKLPFTDTVDLDCDSSGKIKILLPKDIIEEHGLEHEFNGFELKFVPQFPNKKTSYCKTQIITSDDLQIGTDDNFNTEYIKVHNKYLATCEVNRMDTTKFSVRSKYNSIKRHHFTFGDDIDDIVDHCYGTTNKYRFILDPYNLLITKKFDIKSKDKFDEFILDHSNYFSNKFGFIYKENIKSSLELLLGVSEL